MRNNSNKNHDSPPTEKSDIISACQWYKIFTMMKSSVRDENFIGKETLTNYDYVIVED